MVADGILGFGFLCNFIAGTHLEKEYIQLKQDELATKRQHEQFQKAIDKMKETDISDKPKASKLSKKDVDVLRKVLYMAITLWQQKNQIKFQKLMSQFLVKRVRNTIPKQKIK